jgi:hypothetical protein
MRKQQHARRMFEQALATFRDAEQAFQRHVADCDVCAEAPWECATGADGTRVELCERPTGSTRGVRYVRVLRGGAGVSTEQFSGSRASLADGTFIDLASRYSAGEARRHGAALAEPVPAPAAPRQAKAPKAAKAAKPTASEEVVYAAGAVQVVKVSGKPTVFRTLKAGVVVSETPCAPQAWRKTQEAVIAAARAL